eukprot:443034-Hanusia_phi.AAC.1
MPPPSRSRPPRYRLREGGGVIEGLIEGVGGEKSWQESCCKAGPPRRHCDAAVEWARRIERGRGGRADEEDEGEREFHAEKRKR